MPSISRDIHNYPLFHDSLGLRFCKDSLPTFSTDCQLHEILPNHSFFSFPVCIDHPTYSRLDNDRIGLSRFIISIVTKGEKAMK